MKQTVIYLGFFLLLFLGTFSQSSAMFPFFISNQIGEDDFSQTDYVKVCIESCKMEELNCIEDSIEIEEEDSCISNSDKCQDNCKY